MSQKLRGVAGIKAWLRGARKHWQLYAIFLLPLICLAVFKYLPMYGIVIAFKRFHPVKGVLGSSWVGLHYFRQFLSTPGSLGIVLNTLALSMYTLAAGFPFAIVLAIALNECANGRFKKTVQMAAYAPHFISTVVLVSIIMQFTDPRMGVINNLIRLVGGTPVNFMAKSELFPSLYVWSGVWQSAGYSSILYLAALAGVSMELREAAVVDGTNLLQRIWHVDLPSIRPTIVIQLILNMGNILNVGYEKVFLMQNDLNIASSEIISTYVYKVGLQNANYSFSTAIGLMNTLVTFALIIAMNAAAKRMTDSSLW